MIKLQENNLLHHEKMELGEDVTIAMPAYGNYAATVSALQSLFLAARGNFELLLVDNASPDPAVSQLLRQAKAEHENTTLFSFTQNCEYSGALNTILSHARGQWIFFLSNDIFVTPYYLREILRVAQSNPKYGIVRGISNFIDNGKSSQQLRLPFQPTNYEELFELGHKASLQMPEEPIIDEFLTGCAFLVSRKLLDTIGTLDPRFYGYFSDSDLGIRAQIAGFDQVFVRRAFAYHQQSANFNYLPEDLKNEKLNQRWSLVEKNWQHFKEKYGMPADVPYTSISNVPWSRLASQTFDKSIHYFPPVNRLADLVP